MGYRVTPEREKRRNPAGKIRKRKASEYAHEQASRPLTT
jgi:hypothetical protein